MKYLAKWILPILFLAAVLVGGKLLGASTFIIFIFLSGVWIGLVISWLEDRVEE